MRRLRRLAILGATILCPLGAAVPAYAAVYTLEPVTILFVNVHKDLQLTLSGTIDLDTSKGRPFAENVPADISVDVEQMEPGGPFLPFNSYVITLGGDKLDGGSISMFGSPVELVPDQFFISIPLFSYPFPSMFTGTMSVSADPGSPLNVFNGDTGPGDVCRLHLDPRTANLSAVCLRVRILSPAASVSIEVAAAIVGLTR